VASFAAGSQLGPYEILEAIGAGGMGEVYRARDTRLGRTVAIKVLSADISDRVELRERFEREAQTISTLNHPHICTLHDVGRHDGIDYLVMEYLDGETLASRLERGPLPARDAIRVAIEIGDALDKAHRQGIVHRDLKPANVMLTKNGAKLLDFGLAKLRTAEAVSPIAVTATMPADAKALTTAGAILGTLQYMSPEQLQGKDADVRSDIFAFGATMYEMSTGRKAFDGRTQVSLMAAILEHDPPSMSSVQPILPAALNSIVQGCLAKDPEERWQTARDVVKQLKSLQESPANAAGVEPSAALTRMRERFAWGLAAAAFLVAVGMAGLWIARQPEATPQMVRFHVAPPTGGIFPGANIVPRFALSPDGKYLAFEANSGPGTPFQLWIRPLDSTDAQAVAVSPNANAIQGLFWSPDSRFVGFFDGIEQKLKKVDIGGGAPQSLADVPGSLSGGTWNEEGVILVASAETKGIQRVSANGGVPVQVTSVDESQQESRHLWPHFLPDGRHFLYQAQTTKPEEWAVYVGSLDSPERTKIVQSQYMAAFAAPDVVVFLRETTLLAQRLDLKTYALTGEPLLIAPSVAGTPDGRVGVSVSNNGVLAFAFGTATTGNRQLVWIGRDGKQSERLGDPLNATTVKLSPDGKRAALQDSVGSAPSDIWAFEIDRDLRSRLTTDAAADQNPIWSRDGSQVIFNSTRDGVSGLYQMPSNGATSEQLILKGESQMVLASQEWSKDGQWVLFTQARTDRASSRDIWVLPMSNDQKSSDRKPLPYRATPFDEAQPALSPDGRWLAYTTNESGTYEIEVRSFPDPSGGRWPISKEGGMRPRWAADGKELFYQDSRGNIVAVSVAGGQTFQVGTATSLFQTTLLFGLPNTHPWDVMPDGRRFLMSLPISATNSNTVPLTVVVNWATALMP
jgi:Tol biopolymer transport system component/predicted Ser/Thr protein kinase